LITGSIIGELHFEEFLMATLLLLLGELRLAYVGNLATLRLRPYPLPSLLQDLRFEALLGEELGLLRREVLDHPLVTPG